MTFKVIPKAIEYASQSHPPGETTGTGEHPPQRITAPVLAFDLAHEVARLHEQTAWRQGDRNAKTLVKEADFRVVLIALRAGRYVKPKA